MSTKRKPLAQRVEELKIEVEAELDILADRLRPRGEGRAVPAPAMKLSWMAKAAGNPFEALLIAIKESS